MEHINEYLATYGYIFLFFYSLGGGFFATVGASVLAYVGKMDIWVVLFIASLSNFIGDVLLFYLGRFNKKDIFQYIKKQRRKVAYSTVLIKKYGTLTIFVQKFIYGIKTIVPTVMGFSKYSFPLFIFYNFFASIIFMSVVVWLSYHSSEAILAFIKSIEDYTWAYPLILIGILALFWFLIGMVTKKRNVR